MAHSKSKQALFQPFFISGPLSANPCTEALARCRAKHPRTNVAYVINAIKKKGAILHIILS